MIKQHQVNVNYCYGPDGHENDYDFVSQELVRKLVNLKNEKETMV